jgi:hypothetical protein
MKTAHIAFGDHLEKAVRLWRRSATGKISAFSARAPFDVAKHAHSGIHELFTQKSLSAHLRSEPGYLLSRVAELPSISDSLRTSRAVSAHRDNCNA